MSNQSNDLKGLGFAFFRAHCIVFDGSGCEGFAEPEHRGGCMLAREWPWNKAALEDAQP